jgi:methyl-accepting chemotaxis protein
MNPRAWMRFFTIRTRMLGAVAIVTMALMSVGGLGLAAQLYAHESNERFVDHDFEAMTHIAELRHAMSMLLGHQKDMSIAYDHPADAQKAQAAWQSTLEQIHASAKRLQESLSDDAQRARVTEAMDRLDQFKQAFQPVAKTLQDQTFDSARAAMLVMLRSQGHYDAAQSTIEALAVDVKRMADAGKEQLHATNDQAVTLLAAVVLIELAVIVPLTLLNMTSICRPIREAEMLAQSITQGDLAERPIDTSGCDETARLLTALKGMQASLRRMVSQVRESTESISTASVEIASGNHDLSTRTEQTASNLQQTASSMQQITGTVKQSADSARQADQLASSAAEVAARGGQVVSEVVSTMEEINVSSKRIADIIGVIDSIAFQTNILALNAAVEAARAGEQGRGFAVVAGEVRGLAQRSAEAAREIKALIEASVDKVESGSKLVGDAGRTMEEIVSSVQRVTDIIGEISSAAVEQSEGLGRVNGAVAQLDQMTQQNAALVEQSTAAAESLKEQAAQLSRAVGNFRLGTASAPASTGRALSATPAAPARVEPTIARQPPAAVVAASVIATAAASAAAATPTRKTATPTRKTATPTRKTATPKARTVPAKATPETPRTPPPEVPKAKPANDDDWETF